MRRENAMKAIDDDAYLNLHENIHDARDARDMHFWIKIEISKGTIAGTGSRRNLYSKKKKINWAVRFVLYGALNTAIAYASVIHFIVFRNDQLTKEGAENAFVTLPIAIHQSAQQQQQRKK